MAVRTLVLSGGGGRGAFHAGVYKYLMQADKPGLDPEHSGPWEPEIVVGTSIGAVNGAAITQGMTAADLERFWLSLREHDVQGLPPGMGWLARRVTNTLLRHSIGTHLPHIDKSRSVAPAAQESWPPLPVLPPFISKRLIGRWSHLLDTTPLYETLINRMGLDETKIAASDKTFMISATNVRTGEAMIFSNRNIYDEGQPRRDFTTPITANRIIASCSIPMVYPWTHDKDGEVYWDGAVVANTPLGPAIDTVRDRPIEEPMEVVIVMMTPWWESDQEAPAQAHLPRDFGEAMTWTLDWALLASFRVDLKLTRSFNKMAELYQEVGHEQHYRYVQDIIVAPQDFLPVARIIDYDEPASRELIRMGYEAAERAFQAKFGA